MAHFTPFAIIAVTFAIALTIVTTYLKGVMNRMSNQTLGAVKDLADQVAQDEQAAVKYQADTTALLAQNQTLITQLEANQADPATIASIVAELQTVHNGLSAAFPTAPASATSDPTPTTTPAA